MEPHRFDMVVAGDLELPPPTPSDEPATTRLSGQMVGIDRYWSVPVVVQDRLITRPAVQATFVVSTGSPMTFLTEETLRAIGCEDIRPSGCVEVLVNSFELIVGVSHGGFAHVNLLGQDFLAQSRAILRANYDDTFRCEIQIPAERLAFAQTRHRLSLDALRENGRDP